MCCGYGQSAWQITMLGLLPDCAHAALAGGLQSTGHPPLGVPLPVVHVCVLSMHVMSHAKWGGVVVVVDVVVVVVVVVGGAVVVVVAAGLNDGTHSSRRWISVTSSGPNWLLMWAVSVPNAALAFDL